MRDQNAEDFAKVHQRGFELAKKHHYRFLQYSFDELLYPTGLAYDKCNYLLPDNNDFSEYINFLIKLNRDLKEGKGRLVMQRRRA